ncbi:MAG TPA: hypothetical protein PLZ74_02485 [Kiritimatiellia bacterium]|nr:hypothetical protein [Kiritimatiellia bacterium]
MRPGGASSAKGSAIFQTVRFGREGCRKETDAARGPAPSRCAVTVSVWTAEEKSPEAERALALVAHDQTAAPPRETQTA